MGETEGRRVAALLKELDAALARVRADTIGERRGAPGARERLSAGHRRAAALLRQARDLVAASAPREGPDPREAAEEAREALREAQW